jgi:hypothetical protein
MADVAQTGCTQQGVGDGMGQHVGIRMTGQAQGVLHMHTADDQRPPFHQHMQVIALPDPERDVGWEVDALGGMASLGGRGGLGSAGIRGVRIGSHRT